MTVSVDPTGSESAAVAVAPPDHVVATIDGIEVVVPKGTLIIRAAEQVGIEIPRFCDHPLLEPVAACRACLVDVAPGPSKPQPACAVPVADGMTIKTARTSQVAEKAQYGVMEFLLINHPLDCPVCDKGGECPLQNQAMSHGRGESRFTGTKRTFAKPVSLSSQILLDRERCVSCARCTRFADQIAGDPFITLQQRGAKQIVAIADDTPFNSYFSGNTVQICPVGALTSQSYRFRSRPFDLVSTPTVCEHCASGCALRTDVRRQTVTRRLAWEDAAVNEEWNCDKGRFAFPYLTADRIAEPMLDRGEAQAVASWPDALRRAAGAMVAAGPRSAVLVGGKLTLEDAYAYSKFARMVLGTDNVDFRVRRSSSEEADLLRSAVAGSGLGVTFAALEQAPAVLLVGLDPEEESPIIFLRLRKAHLRFGTSIFAVAPFASPGSAKLGARVLAAAPGQETQILRVIQDRIGEVGATTGAALATPGAVILVGERASDTPGALTAAASLAESTGARLAWVPRRAGERGALEAGLLPGLLPWGRPLAESSAREQVSAAWGVSSARLPKSAGLELPQVLAALAADVRARAEAAGAPVTEQIAAVIVAGVDPADLPDPSGFLAALDAAPFVLALDNRNTEVTRRADVVLPVGVVTEKSGTYVNWEGRARPFTQVMSQSLSLTDARVLGLLAGRMGADLGAIDVGSLRRELAGMGRWQGERPVPRAMTQPPEQAIKPRAGGQVLLASWRQLLDSGLLQRGEPALAGTARPTVARVSQGTADLLGLADGQMLRISAARGSVHLPLVVTEMPEGVVWVPSHSVGCDIHSDLGAVPGDIVTIKADGGAA